jgi:hypothetical protein
MIDLVGDVAGMATSVHAALGGIRAGNRALLDRCGGSVARNRGGARDRSGARDGSGARNGSGARDRGGLLDWSSASSASSEDLGARALCRVVGLAAPHAEVNSRISLLVDTRNLDSVGGESVASARDLDLSTAVVELSLAPVCAVETNVLSTDEVLAVWDALGDCEGHSVLAPCAPSLFLGVATGVADGLLVDLEPVTGAVVGTSRGRCLGHVDLSGAWVLHSCSYAKSHGQIISSLDVSSGLCSLVGGSKIAAEVGGVGSKVIERVNPWIMVLVDVCTMEDIVM